MGRVWAAAAWVLAAWACVGVGGVELVEGGYRNLVIALHPQMEEEGEGNTALQNLPSAVEEMGRALAASTGGRVWLESVRVVVPHSWSATTVGGVSLTQPQEDFSWNKADIRLMKTTTDASGVDVPSTLQAGQCGVPGHYITIHTNFLDPAYASSHFGSQGHVLVHEWAHYRWGALEEYGYPTDAVYPASFQDGDLGTVPTACSQGVLEGKFETSAGISCTEGSGDKCYFFPDSNSDASTTKASLMSLTHLSEGTFCDEETHQPWAPTPQNLLCGRRSLWELLRTHPDFQSAAQGSPTSQPEITYHKAPQARIFFLFDAPSSSAQAETINTFVDGVVRKNVELYGSLQLGLATFRTGSEGQMELIKEQGFTSVNDFSSLASLLPDEGDRVQDDGSMPLGDALESVLASWRRYDPGTLLLLLAWNAASVDQVQLIQGDTLLDKKVKLLAVNPDGDLGSLVNLMPLLQDTGGRLYGSTAEVSEDLDKYLMQHTSDDHKLYSSSRVVIPSNTKIRLEVITLQNHLVKKVNGFMHMTPFNPDEIQVFIFHPIVMVELSCEQAADMQNFEFYCVNSDTGVFVYFPSSGAVDLAAEYQLSVENRGGAEVEMTVTWSVVEEDATSPQVTVDVWSSEDAGVRANITEANNIVLFCQISHPRGVVEDVSVEAEVELYDGSNVQQSQVLTLVDDGSRAVDVRARDGVWSGVVRGKWAGGTSLTVSRITIQQHRSPNVAASPRRSSSGGGSAKEGGSRVLPRNPAEGPCCGSYAEGNGVEPVVVNQVLRRPYSTVLTRSVEEVPLLVTGASTDPSRPPTVSGNTVEVFISWTSMTQREEAATEHYMIRYHTTLSQLRDNFQGALQPLEGSDQAPSSATSTTVVLPYNPGDPDVYVAVAYVGSDSVVGPPSPPVIVKISDIVVTTTTTTTPPPKTTPASVVTDSVTTDSSVVETRETDPSTASGTDPTTIAIETTTQGAAASTLSLFCTVLIVLLIMLHPSTY